MNTTVSTMLAAKFPEVENFRIDYMHENVQPVEYLDELGKKRALRPPVASWHVGKTRWKYVLKPTFRSERWQMFILSGSTVRPDYRGEEEKLWSLLQWTVEGKTAKEINELLGSL